MYSFQTHMAQPVEQAIPEVLEQLKREGFGVLMDLDIQTTMKQKIGACGGTRNRRPAAL